MSPILIPILALCIPLSAIIGSFYYKIQKLRIESGGDATLIKKMATRLQMLEEENQKLKQRVENVEEIVTDSAFLLPSPDKKAQANMSDATRIKVEEMARKSRES